MSMDEWTPEGIRAYERAIRMSEQQKKRKSDRKEQWLNDFIDGRPVEQFDEFINT